MIDQKRLQWRQWIYAIDYTSIVMVNLHLSFGTPVIDIWQRGVWQHNKVPFLIV